MNLKDLVVKVNNTVSNLVEQLEGNKTYPEPSVRPKEQKKSEFEEQTRKAYK